MPSRRDFLKTGALAAATLPLVPWSGLIAAEKPLPDSPYRNLVRGRRVRIACVGLGGKGYSDVRGSMDEEIVALCDVDLDYGAKTFNEFPLVPRYLDFRRMLEEMHDKIDAVVVSTPDHMHFPIAMMAIERGKHVYVQKPLTHTIGEARAIKAAAAKAGVVTQMGNQGRAGDGVRTFREWIEAGVIGTVRDVQVWTDRPVWPQGLAWPKPSPAPHANFDWNLWLGVAPYRDYLRNIHPFNWRGLWDYGCGAMGDMGCHLLDAPFLALDLRGDLRATAVSEGCTDITAPTGATVKIDFPARGGRAPLQLTWYEGSHRPSRPAELAAGEELSKGGFIVRGDKGIIYSPSDYAQTLRLLPDERMKDFRRPERRYPRVPKGNPHLEWINAIKGGPACGSDIVTHAADLTELNLIGNLAIRLGRPIEWDSDNARCVGIPEAASLIHKNYRKF